MADPLTLTALALTGAGTAISAGSTIAGGRAAEAGGILAQNQKDYEAKQYEQQAQESRASAQRLAFERRREASLLQSKLQARAAASGGGADDPTIITLSEGIAGRGEYEALMEMYKGENRARGLEDAATNSRFEGQAARWEGETKKRASQTKAIGTIISGLGDMAKMGGGGGKLGSGGEYSGRFSAGNRGGTGADLGGRY